MNITSNTEHGYEILTLKGALDFETVADIRATLMASTESSMAGVVLDMTGVNFIDSSGIGLLVLLYKRLSGDHKMMHLVGLRNQPLNLIKLLRIQQTIPTHGHVSDIASLPKIAV